MDKVQKTSFTDYNAPSSEPFRLHLNDVLFFALNTGAKYGTITHPPQIF
jgi:hypothetical protein